MKKYWLIAAMLALLLAVGAGTFIVGNRMGQQERRDPPHGINLQGEPVIDLGAAIDKATGLVPMVILPQMSLAGAMIPVSAMPKIGAIISNLAISRWAFENMAISTGVSARLDTLVAQRKLPENVYKDVFTSSQLLHWVVLVLFVCVLLTLATLGVKRKDIR